MWGARVAATGRTDGVKLGGTMQDQSKSGQASHSAGLDSKYHRERNVWIITGYAASALALLGVLAYYFSVYVTK